MTEQSSTPSRARNATATRSAILAAALRAFCRAGYDGVGVREIANDAGVTAMMVNRYFGSKEQLFAEVIAQTMAEPTILTTANFASPEFAEQIAATLVDITDAGTTPLDGFLILLHSASSEMAARIGRQQIEDHYHSTLTQALTGDLAPQRAGLLLAVIAGVQVMRQMIGLPALAHADPDSLKRILTPVFEQLLSCDGRRGAPVPERDDE